MFYIYVLFVKILLFYLQADVYYSDEKNHIRKIAVFPRKTYLAENFNKY